MPSGGDSGAKSKRLGFLLSHSHQLLGIYGSCLCGKRGEEREEEKDRYSGERKEKERANKIECGSLSTSAMDNKYIDRHNDDNSPAYLLFWQLS